jgi:hypothetical protein
MNGGPIGRTHCNDCKILGNYSRSFVAKASLTSRDRESDPQTLVFQGREFTVLESDGPSAGDFGPRLPLNSIQVTGTKDWSAADVLTTKTSKIARNKQHKRPLIVEL